MVSRQIHIIFFVGLSLLSTSNLCFGQKDVDDSVIHDLFTRAGDALNCVVAKHVYQNSIDGVGWLISCDSCAYNSKDYTLEDNVDVYQFVKNKQEWTEELLPTLDSIENQKVKIRAERAYLTEFPEELQRLRDSCVVFLDKLQDVKEKDALIDSLNAIVVVYTNAFHELPDKTKTEGHEIDRQETLPVLTEEALVDTYLKQILVSTTLLSLLFCVILLIKNRRLRNLLRNKDEKLGELEAKLKNPSSLKVENYGSRDRVDQVFEIQEKSPQPPSDIEITTKLNAAIKRLEKKICEDRVDLPESWLLEQMAGQNSTIIQAFAQQLEDSDITEEQLEEKLATFITSLEQRLTNQFAEFVRVESSLEQEVIQDKKRNYLEDVRFRRLSTQVKSEVINQEFEQLVTDRLNRQPVVMHTKLNLALEETFGAVERRMQELVEAIKVYFFSYPHPEGFFWDDKKSEDPNQSGMAYQIEINSQNPDEAKLTILEDNKRVVAGMVSSFTTSLEPVCEIEKETFVNNGTNLTILKPGKVYKDGNRWGIRSNEDKMKIKIT